MNTYDKRIAFLISDQHFIPHGGIGSFCKSFTEMCGRIRWKVDVILDKAPTGSFTEIIENAGANIIYAEEPLKYTFHTSTFQNNDTVNGWKISNFVMALHKAMTTNMYDMIVCNTQEAMSAAYLWKLNSSIPVVFYTHLHSMIFRESQGSDVFLDSYHNFYNKHMEFDDIIIGTQSQKNIDELTKHGATNCKLLPMPMSERGLLEPYTGTRKGVLFIGRWEEGKNPDAYIKVMKECQLPCKVMTNSNGQKKFEEAFKEAGITDYEIRAGITGQEKVDFIRSSSVFFMPSLRENYPFAFLECIGHMPCFVLDTQDWSDNFEKKFKFFNEKLKDVSRLIVEAYNTLPEKYYENTKALDKVKELDDNVAKEWITFLDNFVGRRSNVNTAKINSYTTVKYSDYLDELNRGHYNRDDYISAYNNRYKFCNIVYTDKNTYLSKDPTFVPEEDTTGTDLFQFV
jgi:glycosyltransferase involved in cell wall biosynthesis